MVVNTWAVLAGIKHAGCARHGASAPARREQYPCSVMSIPKVERRVVPVHGSGGMN
jgi:hypothetical protein